MPQQITEEDLKNMTPEQIRELQKQQCIFCHIISGKVQSKKIYEDDKVIAILDINPANPGHVLLLPKEHFSIMPQLPDDLISYMFVITKGISQALLRAIHAEGTNVFIANGVVAGQKAPHFMIHIIPRKEKDGVSLQAPEKTMPASDINKLYWHLKKKVNHVFGLPEETPEDIESRTKESDGVAEIEESGTIEKKTKPYQKIVEAEFVEPEQIKEAPKTFIRPVPQKQLSSELDIDKISSLFAGIPATQRATEDVAEEESEEESEDHETEAEESDEQAEEAEEISGIRFHDLARMFAQKPAARPAVKETEEVIREEAEETDAETESDETGIEPAASFFVSSKKSEKYHVPTCPFARKVSKSNKLIFKTMEDAEAAGKESCDCVEAA